MNGKMFCGCLGTTGVLLLLIISAVLDLHDTRQAHLRIALEKHTAPSNPISAIQDHTSPSLHRQYKDCLKYRTPPAEINALLVDIGLYQP